MREWIAVVLQPTNWVDNAIMLITSKTQKSHLSRPACLAYVVIQELYRKKIN